MKTLSQICDEMREAMRQEGLAPRGQTTGYMPPNRISTVDGFYVREHEDGMALTVGLAGRESGLRFHWEKQAQGDNDVIDLEYCDNPETAFAQIRRAAERIGLIVKRVEFVGGGGWDDDLVYQAITEKPRGLRLTR